MDAENIETEFLERSKESLSAAVGWLDRRDFDSDAILSEVGKVAFIGDRLAVPIYQGGALIDVLMVDEAFETETVTGRATWLGTIPCRKTVRLHARPVDWLESGCAGVCYIPLFSRDGLTQLRQARTIECNDITVALEAWDFGFGGDERKLSRFVVDDVPSAIRSYFMAGADWRTVVVAATPEAFR